MITQLRMQNFKSWSDTGTLEVAPLTGLFGTNSSGKTSILQMLLMLKQTVESPDRRRVLHTGDERSLVDLGTFFDIIHGHQADLPLNFSLSWNLPETLIIDDPERNRRLFNIDKLQFETTIKQTEKLWVDSFVYSFQDYRFGMQRKEVERRQRKLEKDEYELISENYHAKRTPGRVWPLRSPIKCYGFPDEATGYFQNTGFLPDFVLAFEELFSNVFYLGPLREYPKRTYVWAGESPVDVGQRGELAIPALLASRARRPDISPGYRRRRRTVE